MYVREEQVDVGGGQAEFHGPIALWQVVELKKWPSLYFLIEKSGFPSSVAQRDRVSFPVQINLKIFFNLFYYIHSENMLMSAMSRVAIFIKLENPFRKNIRSTLDMGSSMIIM